jgi:hypothetical protein
MSISFGSEIQTWTFTNTTQATAVTVSSTIAAGSFVIIPWQNGNNNSNILASVTDSQSNSYALTATNTSDTNRSCGIAYGFISSALASGVGTITMHWTSTANNFKMGAIEVFSGLASTSPLDVNTVAGDTFGTAVSNPITTVKPSTVVFYVQGQEQTNVYTVAGSFTAIGQVTNNSRLDYGYRIVSSAGTYNPAGSYATNTNWFSSIASFAAGFTVEEDYWVAPPPTQDDPNISVF